MTPAALRVWVCVFVWMLHLACAGCAAPEPRPPVILISIDTTRSDHLSVYGYSRDTTPELRDFAAEGARFDQAYAPSASTGPSHATLFTSLYPIAHGVVKNGLALATDSQTLAEILSAQGYATAAVVSSFPLDSRFGFDQGFDFYDDEFPLAGSTEPTRNWGGQTVRGGFDRRAQQTTTRAIETLERLAADSDSPFLLFVHYFDPHAPYRPPTDFAERFLPDADLDEPLSTWVLRYDAEIAFVDQQIGRLLRALERLDLADDTLVVITADHGEGLDSHDFVGHGVHLYEEAVRVPLLMRWPGRIPAGRTLAEPVALIDVAPTILDLAGAEQPDGIQGNSLARAVRGESNLDPDRAIYLHRRHYEGSPVGPEKLWAKGEKYGIRVGRWKYIEGLDEGTRELFDLQEDPGERHNRVRAEPERAAELSARIAAWRDSLGRDRAREAISEADLRGLEALGYVE